MLFYEKSQEIDQLIKTYGPLDKLKLSKIFIDPETCDQILLLLFTLVEAEGTEQIVSEESIPTTQKLRYLTQLFNIIDISHRYDLFKKILTLARVMGEFELLIPSLSNLPEWLTTWNVNVDQKCKLFLLLCDALASIDYKYTLMYMEVCGNSPAKGNINDLVKRVLQFPDIYIYEDLNQTAAIQGLSGLMRELLDIFVQGGYKEFKAFEKKNATFIKDQGMNHALLLSKIRILTFATFVKTRLNTLIDFHSIVEILDVPVEDVEMWVVNVIRSGLANAKIYQLDKKLIVSRCVHRVFGPLEWKVLEESISEHQEKFDKMLAMVTATQKYDTISIPM